MKRRQFVQSAALVPFAGLGTTVSTAAPTPDNAWEKAQLYPGELALYEAARKEGQIVSWDTEPTWANWKALFDAFNKRYPGIKLHYNSLGSAMTVTALGKSRRRPQADTAYYFAASAVEAVNQGVAAPLKPINFDKLPESFRDPEGKWFGIHTLTLAFVVNKKLVRNTPISWADLLKPEYKNSIVYLDPRSAGVGQVVAFAAAYANGGSVDDVKPGIDYLGKLHATGNVIRTEGTTPYSKFMKGEIPIWISYENDGLKAKYTEKGMTDVVDVVIPKEASVAAHYGISLVKNGPHPNAGKLWLNFIMSEIGQQLFAKGFVRPLVKGISLPPDIQQKMPKALQTRSLDVIKAAARKSEVDRLWAKAVLIN
jgi:putative spermidine/putrescine transport system substrate-binding protein